MKAEDFDKMIQGEDRKVGSNGTTIWYRNKITDEADEMLHREGQHLSGEPCPNWNLYKLVRIEHDDELPDIMYVFYNRQKGVYGRELRLVEGSTIPPIEHMGVMVDLMRTAMEAELR